MLTLQHKLQDYGYHKKVFLRLFYGKQKFFMKIYSIIYFINVIIILFLETNFKNLNLYSANYLLIWTTTFIQFYIIFLIFKYFENTKQINICSLLKNSSFIFINFLILLIFLILITGNFDNNIERTIFLDIMPNKFFSNTLFYYIIIGFFKYFILTFFILFYSYKFSKKNNKDIYIIYIILNFLYLGIVSLLPTKYETLKFISFPFLSISDSLINPSTKKILFALFINIIIHSIYFSFFDILKKNINKFLILYSLITFSLLYLNIQAINFEFFLLNGVLFISLLFLLEYIFRNNNSFKSSLFSIINILYFILIGIACISICSNKLIIFLNSIIIITNLFFLLLIFFLIRFLNLKKQKNIFLYYFIIFNFYILSFYYFKPSKLNMFYTLFTIQFNIKSLLIYSFIIIMIILYNLFLRWCKRDKIT